MNLLLIYNLLAFFSIDGFGLKLNTNRVNQKTGITSFSFNI